MTELNQITSEAMEDSGLDPGAFDPGYRQREDQIRNHLARYHEHEYALRREIKANVDLSPEARQDLYRVRHQSILDNFYRDADQWTENHLQSRLAAYRQLHAANGSEFSDYIMRASSMDDETLERSYRTAKRSGALELARALAQAAYDRGLGPVRHIFEDWAESDPVRADALRMLRTTPGQERTYTRIQLATKPPTVTEPGLLEPSYEDHQRAEEKRRQEERERRNFFDTSPGPRRRFGRRSRSG
jgi:hypothetical protein